MKTIIASLIIACAMVVKVTQKDTPDVVAARAARDHASIEDLHRLVTKAKIEAAASNSADAYIRIALYSMWLCEAVESHQKNEMFKNVAEEGVAAAEKAVALNSQIV
jgi:hypothetical protein